MIQIFPSRTVALDIAGLSIHWYGILYLAGFLAGWFLLPRLQKYRDLHLTSDQWSAIISTSVVGVLLGGRLGYVLFYDPMYYLAHPLEVFAIWKGGMSSHGGFLAVATLLLLGNRKWKLPALRVADILTVPLALGLMLGRVGNFINLELYGTMTNLPWGMDIPGVEGLRHPTQIYAILKDLFIAGVCFLHLRKVQSRPGETLGLFLFLYGLLRFLIEFLRVQTSPPIDLGVMILTRGQLLTIPIIIAGIVILLRARRGAPSAPASF